MGRGAVTLFLDTLENREVAGGAGLAFTHANLNEVIAQVLAMSEEERESWRTKAMQRVRERYSWDAVTDAYEKLLTGLTK
jgi:glycosyltransferase involved in cell wall biosynthesis